MCAGLEAFCLQREKQFRALPLKTGQGSLLSSPWALVSPFENSPGEWGQLALTPDLSSSPWVCGGGARCPLGRGIPLEQNKRDLAVRSWFELHFGFR